MFPAVCLNHGRYDVHVGPEDSRRYLDLATLYRNVIEERALGRGTATLHVMMTDGAWAFGCQFVGGALARRGTPRRPQALLPSYPSFDDMFDHEPATSVNPTATRDEQLANIRQIYPPEREALGVVAIGIELVDPPRPQATTARVH